MICCCSTYLVRIVTYKKLICVGHVAMEVEVKEEHGVLWSALEIQRGKVNEFL